MASWWQSQVTPGGYPFPEVISALQKHIRRGEEREAMECAIQIEALQPKYLWNRLRIIASEDIGPADSSVALLVDTLGRNYEEAVKRGNDATRLFLGHAILSMCRAPKSRIVDNFIIAAYMDDEGWYEVPDYALDKHTPRGRKLGRGVDHFIEEGAHVDNEVDLPGASGYRQKAAGYLRDGRKWRYSGQHGQGEERQAARSESKSRNATPLFGGK